MKASVPTLTDDIPVDKTRMTVLSELFKARLTTLVLLTTFIGFYLGTVGAVDYLLLLHTLVGTALLACGSSVLNQWLEREHDAKMRRTEDRPLPTGRISPDNALKLGGALSAAGLVYLAFSVNLLTSLLGAATLILYVLIYTPLKRVTTLNTVIGAVPGALPPLMGWTAAQGQISIQGWSLFAILFFWQLPHFLAIAWMYREDYARAGFQMLPIVDPSGSRTGRQAVSHTLGLLVISFFPYLYRMVGTAYVTGALVLGMVFLGCAVRFAHRLDRPSARALFFVSIIYLPLMMILMVLDKM
jgi:protoheme IX farnesyltransferase